jgi:3-oxoacyl-[acyl-carrier protein] reductase
MKCKGQIAIVTGGASGIGRAIALTLANEGGRVAVWDVNEGQAAKTATEIEALGEEAISSRVNVSCGTDVKTATDIVLEKWGRIDILVNNAGICNVIPIENITADEWDRVLAVNLKGTFLCSQAVMGVMKRQRSGKIINMGSVSGKVGGIAVGAHYSASKAGVMCFTKSLAREMAPFGVNVNAIAPGIIETEMTQTITDGNWDNYLNTIPMGRLGTVNDVAKAVVFLASNESSYITGEIMDVNGGQFMD